jgi:hypothetical protein
MMQWLGRDVTRVHVIASAAFKLVLCVQPKTYSGKQRYHLL